MSIPPLPFSVRLPHREVTARRVQLVTEPTPTPLRYLSVTDLVRRWRYTKRGVINLTHRADFPSPVFLLQGGRMRVWAAADIEAYERDRPELHSEEAKLRKVNGFLRAKGRGQRPLVDPLSNSDRSNKKHSASRRT